MLKASEAFRWGKCLLAGHPAESRQDDKSSMFEGLAAHQMAAAVLNGGASCAADLIGRISREGIEYSPEMAACVQIYIDYVCRRTGALYIETAYNLDDVIIVKPDAVIMGTDYVEVIEFKYGWKIVDPAHNLQLTLGTTPYIYEKTEKVILTVVQPRPAHRFGHIRTWITSYPVIAQEIEYLKLRAREILKGANTALPGPHCVGCGHITKCATAGENIYAAFDLFKRTSFCAIQDQDMHRELRFLRDAALLVKERLIALEAELTSRLNAGQYIPGVFLKPRYGHRVFTATQEQIEAMTGQPAVKEVPVTPADLARDGVSPSVIEALTTVPNIGSKPDILTDKEIAKVFRGN